MILAAGRPAHLRHPVLGVPKALLPVANRPVAAYALDLLQRAGIAEVGVVVESRDGPMAAWPGWRSRPGMKIFFLEQSLPLGTAHAVKMAQGFVGGDLFLVIAGDCLLDGGLAEFLEWAGAARPAAGLLLAAVPDPEAYGVADVAGDRVLRLVEKRERPPGNLALAGVYVFSREIFAAIDVMRPSARGDLELTGAVQLLLERGLPVLAYQHRGFWRDMGRPQAILEANTFFLDRLAPDVKGEVSRSHLEGRVSVGLRARVINSHIVGPVAIGEGTAVINSWIGPFSAIGDHVVIEDCEAERSVIMNNCRLRGVARLEGSVIGEGSRVGRRASKPLAYRLTVGERSEIEVP